MDVGLVDGSAKSKPNGICRGRKRRLNPVVRGLALRCCRELIVLAELKAVHAELRAAIAGLEVETCRPAPQDETLSQARLSLSRLSNRRNSLLDCTIYPRLHGASAPDARQLAELQLDAAQRRIASSEHIARWTMRAIHADWPGYCDASRDMRQAMLRRIDREAAILYPLLQPLSQAAAA
jgi:hypothetical protein